MNDYSNRFAVIGAGPVGLCIAKALKQHGLPYDQLEADADVGGNWRHGVYATAHIISSKRTTEYSDFPMPADYPDFPSRQQMVEYLRAYAEHFELRPNIQFNTKVVLARPTTSQPQTQQWELALANGERRVYKGLLVCNGHHWDRRWPSYPGQFSGAYFHSKDYKTPEQLAGQRVLVVGGGNSACDIASEAARVGASCHLSLRRGYWFLPKTFFGRPLVEVLSPWLPVPLQRVLLRALLRVSFGKYEQYGLPTPDHRIFEHHPTINSELLHYLKHGRITPKPDVARFADKQVHFVDGSVAEFDTVVCATGFNVSFPFLPPGLVPVQGGNALLYGGVCLPGYKHLYIVGTAQPRYGFGPLVTRAAEVIAQTVQLQEQMELPIGLVMKEAGAKLPTTHLLNPHALLRQMWRAQKTLPLLLRKERRLRRKSKAEAFMAAPPLDVQTKPDLQVY